MNLLLFYTGWTLSSHQFTSSDHAIKEWSKDEFMLVIKTLDTSLILLFRNSMGMTGSCQLARTVVLEEADNVTAAKWEWVFYYSSQRQGSTTRTAFKLPNRERKVVQWDWHDFVNIETRKQANRYLFYHYTIFFSIIKFDEALFIHFHLTFHLFMNICWCDGLNQMSPINTCVLNGYSPTGGN